MHDEDPFSSPYQHRASRSPAASVTGKHQPAASTCANTPSRPARMLLAEGRIAVQASQHDAPRESPNDARQLRNAT